MCDMLVTCRRFAKWGEILRTLTWSIKAQSWEVIDPPSSEFKTLCANQPIIISSDDNESLSTSKVHLKP